MDMTGEDFRVQEGKKVTLDTWPTRVKPVYTSKKTDKVITRIAHITSSAERRSTA